MTLDVPASVFGAALMTLALLSLIQPRISRWLTSLPSRMRRREWRPDRWLQEGEDI